MSKIRLLTTRLHWWYHILPVRTIHLRWIVRTLYLRSVVSFSYQQSTDWNGPSAAHICLMTTDYWLQHTINSIFDRSERSICGQKSDQGCQVNRPLATTTQLATKKVLDFTAAGVKCRLFSYLVKTKFCLRAVARGAVGRGYASCKLQCCHTKSLNVTQTPMIFFPLCVLCFQWQPLYFIWLHGVWHDGVLLVALDSLKSYYFVIVVLCQVAKVDAFLVNLSAVICLLMCGAFGDMRIVKKKRHVKSNRAIVPSGHMTLLQRRINFDATWWRCIDVDATFYPLGSLRIIFTAYLALK